MNLNPEIHRIHRNGQVRRPKLRNYRNGQGRHRPECRNYPGPGTMLKTY